MFLSLTNNYANNVSVKTRRVHTKKELVQSSRLLRKPQVSIALEIMNRDSVSRKYIPVPQNQPQLLKHLDSLSNYEKDGASPTVR